MGGGDIHNFSVLAVPSAATARGATYAVGEKYAMNRNMLLLRHQALIMSSHPEDSMGDDIVEYLVVFSSAMETSTR